MKVREEKLRTIIEWSEKNEDVRVLLLTSSLVNPLALVDEFSDLDIEFVFEDNTNYISDKSWTLKFGNPIAMIEEDESCFNHKHAMKMLLYEDGVKVDFKLYSKSKFIKETQEKELPEDWDIGYKILIDKDGITKQMLKPTYQISIIKKPSEKEFQNLINDFWWDTTYVAKCLVRDEIFYAKFMSETVIRTEYLIPLIEWHIASEHNWNITTNKYGRLFKKYLNQEMWAKTEQTFSGSDIKENWTALFSGNELFDGLRDKTTVLFGEFIADAQALAAIFMLLYFGVESFKMMSGDKKLEIIPLLRPFALGLVLMFWIPFINLISYPGELLTARSKAMFTNQIEEVELLSRNRYALIDSVAVELLHTSLEVERAENEVKDKKWYDFSIDFSAIGDKIAGLYVYVVAKVKMIMFNIIEFIVVTFWQVCTYFVFFLQIIFTGILVILGPLAFAFSVLPAFRDAYIQWIARFVSVSLYSCIAYIVLSISLVVMQYGIEREIEILEYALRNEAAFVMYVGMTSGGVNSFLLTALLGAFAMLTIPFVSTWIVSTTGVGQAVGGMVGGAAIATKAVAAPATGGASAAM